MSDPFRHVAPLYRSDLQPGRFAHIVPLNPLAPDLRDSLRRYWHGDTHMLDLDNAVDVEIWTARLWIERRNGPVSHFLAAIVLDHLLYHRGVGGNQAQAPLILAAAVVQQCPGWREGSLRFLRALYSQLSPGELSESKVYLETAIAIVQHTLGHEISSGRFHSENDLPDDLEKDLTSRIASTVLADLAELRTSPPDVLLRQLRAIAARR
jgi:hypothetical protein